MGQFATRWGRKIPWTLCLLHCWARLVSVEQWSGLISEDTTAVVPELGWQVVGNVFLLCCLHGLELQWCPCGDIPQCLVCLRGRLSRQDRRLSVWGGLFYLASRGNQRPFAVKFPQHAPQPVVEASDVMYRSERGGLISLPFRVTTFWCHHSSVAWALLFGDILLTCVDRSTAEKDAEDHGTMCLYRGTMGLRHLLTCPWVGTGLNMR